MMQSDNPFIKLMILGRVNGKIGMIMKKKNITEMDVKLLKGLLLQRGNEIKKRKKSIH